MLEKRITLIEKKKKEWTNDSNCKHKHTGKFIQMNINMNLKTENF